MWAAGRIDQSRRDDVFAGRSRGVLAPSTHLSQALSKSYSAFGARWRVSAHGRSDAVGFVFVRCSIDCHDNQLTSLEPLRELKQLSALYCGENRISTLELVKAPNLFWLYWNNNQIESLEPLSALKTLDTLYCGQNRIKDLSPLNGKLQALDCSHSQIRSLDPISRLPQLSQLYCRSNQISSLEPLRQVKNLSYLDAAWTPSTPWNRSKILPSITSTAAVTRSWHLNHSLTPRIHRKYSFLIATRLPDDEIERAIAAWFKKGINVDYGRASLRRERQKVASQPA
jgi:hypothetical protein